MAKLSRTDRIYYALCLYDDRHKEWDLYDLARFINNKIKVKKS